MQIQTIDILDNLLTGNKTINTIAIILMICAVAVGFAMMLNKISVKIIVGFLAMILIFFDAWGVIPEIFGAFGFILLALVVVWAIHSGGKE